MHRRKYKSGTRWCFWRYTDVDSEYITRLHVVKTPWFAICLHWINKPDPEPYLHDHPVSFLSLILRGGYTERRAVGAEASSNMHLADLHEHRWWNFIRATPTDRHRIVRVEPHTLTLCLMGPKTREWGFHTERGWVYWKDYHHAQCAERAATETRAK